MRYTVNTGTLNEAHIVFMTMYCCNTDRKTIQFVKNGSNNDQKFSLGDPEQCRVTYVEQSRSDENCECM